MDAKREILYVADPDQRKVFGYQLVFTNGMLMVEGDPKVRTPVNNIEYFPPNFEGLVLGCIDADFCK